MISRVENGAIAHTSRNGMARKLDELQRAKVKYRARARALDAEVRSRTSEIEQQSEELRDLSSRLLQAQDEERRRIARELHDSAGQTLVLLSLGLARAVDHAPKTNGLFNKFTNECEHLVDQLSRELRTMSYLLHPPLLDELGLSNALQWFVTGLMQRSGLEIAVETPADFPRLRRELELVIFRLVQECLTNIHRHSGSKSAVIRMTLDENELFLSIRDEGMGVPPDKLSEIQTHGGGVGIRGMRERVRHFGGIMAIESSPEGTMVCFKFPFCSIAPLGPDAFTGMQSTNSAVEAAM